MNQWALPTIAVLLIGYGALSGRLESILAPTDAADTSTSHLGFRCTIGA
jgi:hypothetical protein